MIGSRLAVGRRWLLSPQLALVCRLALGGIFVAAGLSKIGHQADVVQSVKGFNILPSYFVQPFAVALPWVELLSGALLILGLLVPSASALLALLNVAFLFAIGVNLMRGTSDINCGCFGKEEPLSWEVFIRDVGFLLLSLQILAAKRGFLTLEGAISTLWHRRRGLS